MDNGYRHTPHSRTWCFLGEFNPVLVCIADIYALEISSKIIDFISFRARVAPVHLQ